MHLIKNLFQKPRLLVIILCLTVVSYLPILGSGFTIDDHIFIEQWEELRSPDLLEFFKGSVPPGHEGVYRPVRSLLYAVVFSVAGTNPLAYHVVSLLIHLTGVWLVFEISLILGKKFLPQLKQTDSKQALIFAGLVGLIFGIHPAHTEAIAYTAASFDTFGMVLSLGSFLLWLKWIESKKRNTLTQALLLFALACFSHETALVLPLFMVIQVALESRKPSLKQFTRTLLFFVVGTIALVVRLSMVGLVARGEFLVGSVYFTALTMSKVLIKYLELFIFPLKLANQHILNGDIEAFIYRGYNRVPILSQTLLQPYILLGIIIFIFFIIIAIYLWRRQPLVTLGISWFLITLLPVSQLIPQGAVLNERSLYIPSLGLTWILALLLLYVFKRSIKIFSVILIVLSLFYGVRTFTRTLDWRDDISLWSADLSTYPNSAYAHYSLGNALMEKQEYEKAQLQFEMAVSNNPNFAVAQASVGNALFKKGEIAQAAIAFERAAAIDPQFFEVYINLGNSYQSLNFLDKARAAYQKATEINPGYTPAQTALTKLAKLYPQTPTHTYDGKFFSFSYPIEWSVKSIGKKLSIKDANSNFTIQLEVLPRTPLDTLDEINNKYQSKLGVKINEGKAALPGTQEALVRIWEKNKLKIYEFLVLTDDLAVQAVVSPGDSPQMREFDRLFDSLKIKPAP